MKRIAKVVLLLMVLPLLLSIDFHKEESEPVKVDYLFHFTTYEHYVQKLQVEEHIKESNELAIASLEEPKQQKEKSYTDEDLYWLSRIVSAESKDEPVEGQIAVANVVLNRVASDEFPDTIKEVVFQRRQFSPVGNGAINDEPTKEAIESAKKALEGEKVIKDGVYYFFNPKIAKVKWNFKRKVATTIGNHRFTY